MSIRGQAGSKAFGIEEGHAPYRLRQARYYELGQDCAALAKAHYEQLGQPVDLLDIGTYDGVTRKYVEAFAGGEHVRYHAVDIFPHGREFVYKHQDWELHNINLEKGLPGLASNRYDIVVCEQVLEHLHHVEEALSGIERVLKPGGMLVLGVPIFPPGLHLVRKHVVPVTDKLFKVKKVRGHVQGWSRGSFLNLVSKACPQLEVHHTRGFRVVSGGVLRGLEWRRWWWQLNRRVGRLVPGLCIDLQVVAYKRADQHALTLPMFQSRAA